MAYTFTTLKQAIQDYTENTETTFVNNLSRFIQNAEERLYKTLQIPSLREVVDSTLISCLLYTSPSPRDGLLSRMPSSA